MLSQAFFVSGSLKKKLAVLKYFQCLMIYFLWLNGKV